MTTDCDSTRTWTWPKHRGDRAANVKAFEQARFGLFMHYGVYSLLGRGEWVRYHENIPAVEYEKLAHRFTAEDFNADEWAALARRAGMCYAVLTAKHHDGFCLWNSKTTAFNSVNSAAKRDLIAEHVAACRRAGLGVGIYLSVKDWSIPAYFDGPKGNLAGWRECVARFHAHLEEILTGYGQIDILWFDCPDDANFRNEFYQNAQDVWGGARVRELIDRHQPWLVYNNRGTIPGGYATPEQEIPMSWSGGHFEACITSTLHNWGWCPAESLKPTEQLIHSLVAIAACGGNLLLNFAPTPTGAPSPDARQRLADIAGWMRVHADAIYDSQRLLPPWWNHTSTGRIITRDHLAFLIVHRWPETGELIVTQLANQVKGAQLLGCDIELRVNRAGRAVRIAGLPPSASEPAPAVIRLTLDAPACYQPHY